MRFCFFCFLVLVLCHSYKGRSCKTMACPYIHIAYVSLFYKHYSTWLFFHQVFCSVKFVVWSWMISRKQKKIIFFALRVVITNPDQLWSRINKNLEENFRQMAGSLTIIIMQFKNDSFALAYIIYMNLISWTVKLEDRKLIIHGSKLTASCMRP